MPGTKHAAVTFFFAFVVVLALIGVAAWLVRRFAGNRLGANTNRGRMPRLAVIDAAAVDGRRRLVLVRRDNIEHLLMIGGPTDIVVEPNIVRAMPGRDQMAPRPAVAGARTAAASRRCPMPAAGPTAMARSDMFDHGEPQMPEPPPRPVRPSFADEVRRPAPAPAQRPQRRSDPLAGFTPEPLGRARTEPRAAPSHARTAPRTDAVAGHLAQRADDAARRRGLPKPPKAPPPVRAPAERPPPPPPPIPSPRSRARTRISPRWRNGWRRHCAGRPSRPKRRRAAGRARTAAGPRPPRAPSRRWRRRWRRAEEQL